MKTIAIGELFTAAEIAQARAIVGAAETKDVHQRILTEIAEPALQRINAQTDQENSPRYLAYMLEYAARYDTTHSEAKIGLRKLAV